MAQFSDVLLTADYDRTLTAPDSTIPPRNLEAIRYFIENGGAFTVNTGRSLAMFRPHIPEIPVSAPFLLYNGCAAYDPKTDELSLLHPIALEPWEVLDNVMAHFPDLLLEVQAPDAHYCCTEDAGWAAYYESGGYAHRFAVHGQPFEPFLKFAVMGKVNAGGVSQVYSGTPQELRRMDELENWLRATYGDTVEVLRSSPRLVDVNTKGITKIFSARQLQKELGRKILVCIGDAENDREMLSGADFAYCPADGGIAADFPNVCPCAQGAVADVIYNEIPKI